MPIQGQVNDHYVLSLVSENLVEPFCDDMGHCCSQTSEDRFSGVEAHI